MELSPRSASSRHEQLYLQGLSSSRQLMRNRAMVLSARELREVSDCTFAPSLSHYVPQTATDYKKDFVKAVERLRKGNAMRQERLLITPRIGRRRRRHRLTIPQPFSFGDGTVGTTLRRRSDEAIQPSPSIVVEVTRDDPPVSVGKFLSVL
jgi:hypothetical protein